MIVNSLFTLHWSNFCIYFGKITKRVKKYFKLVYFLIKKTVEDTWMLLQIYFWQFFSYNLKKLYFIFLRWCCCSCSAWIGSDLVNEDGVIGVPSECSVSSGVSSVIDIVGSLATVRGGCTAMTVKIAIEERKKQIRLLHTLLFILNGFKLARKITTEKKARDKERDLKKSEPKTRKTYEMTNFANLIKLLRIAALAKFSDYVFRITFSLH